MRDIPFVVFEKDTSFSSRSQGYALTIQQGIQAFDDLGLKVDMVEGSLSLIEKEVSKVLFCTSHSHVSLSRMGEVIGAYGPPHSPKSSQEEANIRNKRKKEKKNFHIPRQFLRELLLRGFDNSRIKWGHNLQGYECIDQSNENSGLLLHFHGQCSFPVKGLVACDGIYSSVRQLKEYYAKRRSYDDETKLLRPDKELNFLGLFVILGMTKGDVGCRCCTVSTDSSGYLRRKVQWVDGSTRVFSMPYDRHRVMWQLSFPFSREKLEQLFTASKTTPQSLKDMAMQQCQGWHSVLTSMIQNSPDSQITGHPVYDVEPKEFSTLRGNCLESHINFDEDCHFHEKSPVTLLGDAFHPMSPFKGQVSELFVLAFVVLNNVFWVAGGKSSVVRRTMFGQSLRRTQSTI